MFVCEVCGNSFTLKGNLDRHSKSVHNINKCRPEGSFQCIDCEKKFVTKYNLERHCKNKHAMNLVETSEVEVTKKNQVSISDELCCGICGMPFSKTSNLHKHLKNIHNELVPSKHLKKLCSECDESFPNYKQLIVHLEQHHDFKPVIETFRFDTVEAFKTWKLKTEKQDVVQFVTRSSKKEAIIYFTCSRCTTDRSDPSKRQTERISWKPSFHMSKTCPAYMKMACDETGVSVTYQKTHLGHICSVKYLRLSQEERLSLAGRLQSGVPMGRILDDIRQSVAECGDVQRLHLVDKKDLHNIKRDFNLERDRIHDNDAWSIHLWVLQQRENQIDSPLVYYKAQDKPDPDQVLKKEDFMIVIITKYQREELVKFCSDKICIDSTHNMTSHDFQLTTILVVDDFGAGVPLAHCISNRVDSEALVVFFQSVQNVVGKIQAKVLMTDDAPAFLNAWRSVMGNPEHNLLCTWHIDRSWRGNLSKISNRVKQSEVYRALRLLLEIVDVEEFLVILPNVLKFLHEDEETKLFASYFEQHYASRPQQWAFCYRLQLGINTNMYLEALHKKLKYCYMDGKRNRRVDKCLALLLRFLRDVMFERIIRSAKNKPTHRMNEIASSHKRSKEVSEGMVRRISEWQWEVDSRRSGSGPYIVTHETENSDHDHCPLACPICKICIHQYSCTCIDSLIKGNICKHIHACIQICGDGFNEMGKEMQDDVFSWNEQATAIAAETSATHLQDSVTRRTRLKAVADMMHELACNAPESAVSYLVDRAEKCLQDMQQHLVNCGETTQTIPEFQTKSLIHSNQNIEPQPRFHSTKKKISCIKPKLSKPSDLEKQELKKLLKENTAVDSTNLDYSSE